MKQDEIVQVAHFPDRRAPVGKGLKQACPPPADRIVPVVGSLQIAQPRVPLHLGVDVGQETVDVLPLEGLDGLLCHFDVLLRHRCSVSPLSSRIAWVVARDSAGVPVVTFSARSSACSMTDLHGRPNETKTVESRVCGGQLVSERLGHLEDPARPRRFVEILRLPMCSPEHVGNQIARLPPNSSAAAPIA